MAEVLRIKINRRFRNPVEAESSAGTFCGREHELSRLKHTISNRPSAAILISGVRGVGKTSFVRESIRQLKNDKSATDLITAYISFADIDCSNPKELRATVLKTLIRALYFALDPSDRKEEEIATLYDKTYFSNLESSGVLELATSNEIEERRGVIREQKISFSVTEGVVELVRLVLASIFTFGGLSFAANAIATRSIGFGVVAVLFMVVVLAALKLRVESKTSSSDESTARDEATTKTSTSQSAVYDLSADALEIQLEQVLATLTSKRKKVVFVIDELDKLVTIDTTHPIYEVVRPLKNLFNLSKSIFVFVGADDFYDYLERERVENPYSSSHTLFTDKLFLSSLYHDEVKQLIDNYKEEVQVGDEKMYAQFKAYISWEARNHVFDVHRLLDDFAVYHGTENEMFVSVIERDDTRRGNITDKWEMVAGLQLFIAITFDYYRRTGANRFSEKLFLTLRAIAQIYSDDLEITVEDNDYLGILSEVMQEKLKIDDDHLTRDERQDLEGAIEDFLKRMLRLEERDFAGHTRKVRTDVSDPSKPKEIKIDYYELLDTAFPDEQVIRERNRKLSFEIEFLEAFSELKEMRTNLRTLGWQSRTAFDKEIVTFSKLAERITQEQKNREPKSIVVKATQDVIELKDEWRTKMFADLVSQMVTDSGASEDSMTDPTVLERAKSEIPMVASYIEHVNTKVNKDYFALLRKDDKWALLQMDFEPEQQDEYLEIGLTQRRKSPLKCINIIAGTGLEPTKKGQTKWVEEPVKANFSDLASLCNRVRKHVLIALG